MSNQHYNYAASASSSVNLPSNANQPVHSSSMMMSTTCASMSSNLPSNNPSQPSHLSASNYGSASYDPLSSHAAHVSSGTNPETGSAYQSSYYRQTSLPSYPSSFPLQQQQQQQQSQQPSQLTRQVSSNYPMTTSMPSNAAASNPTSPSSVGPFR
jgi:hypothetical protein